MKIIKKFSYYFLLPLLGLLLFIFYFTYIPTMNVLEENADEKLLTIADSVNTEISDRIGVIKSDLIVMRSYKEFNEYYDYLGVGQIDEADRRTIAIQHNFVNLGDEKDEYTALRFYDTGGRALISVVNGKRSYVAVHVMDTEWFKESLRLGEGGVHVSEVYTSPEYPEPMLTISLPVYHRGKLKGIVSIDSRVEDIFGDFLMERSFGKQGQAYLVAPSGEILVHHLKERMHENVSGLYSTNRIFEGYRGITVELGEDGETRMRKVYMPLESTNIGLLVEIPLYEIMGPVIQMRNTILPVVLIGFLLLTQAGLKLVRRITAPIENLTEISKSMSAGDLDVRADITSDDEIAELADSFNQMAADLKEYSAGLEKKVEERTLELQKAFNELALIRSELVMTVKELKSSNELKGLFTDIMRHDLLNPVGIIRNIAEIMEEDKGFSDSTELQVIKRNVKKLEDIVRNASDYARFESAESIEKVDLDLAKIIKSVISDLTPYAKDKKMKITFKPDGECMAKVGSAIESVFVNLLSNAIKYSPESTEIKIAILDLKKNWKISVADRGDGIMDKHKTAVFDRFTRKDKSGVKGTGLGLAIVKRIVEMHRGRVWVEDNPLDGSIFYVEIPK